MGSFFTKLASLFDTFGDKNKDYRVIMLGLDNAGKTTLLYKLKLNQVVTTIPTIGFNVETVKHKNMSLTIWDVGGQDKLRSLWHHYYRDTDAVIFVVDSNDLGRLKEAAHELMGVLKDDALRDANLLVMVNKQDLPHAMNANAVAAELGLYGLKGRNWYVQPCTATSGDGVYEGIDWLSSSLRG